VDVLFDLNGTLLDPAPLAAGFPGAPRGLALSILDQAVMAAMTDTVTGEFRAFPEYLAAAIAHRAAVAGLGEEAVEAGTTAAQALPPYPDAAAALRALRERGHTPHVLTNSAADAAERALQAGGLRDLVDRVLGAAAVGAYKPDARVYRHALDALGVEAASTWMVAGHWWDVAGAKRAGLRTVWVGRDEGALLRTVPAPDALVEDLGAVADAIARAGD